MESVIRRQKPVSVKHSGWRTSSQQTLGPLTVTVVSFSKDLIRGLGVSKDSVRGLGLNKDNVYWCSGSVCDLQVSSD